MIKYKLICKQCNLTYDSWFASSKEYEKLKRKNFLSCLKCDSNQIEKTLMAPKILNKSFKEKINIKNSKLKEIKKKIQEYNKFVKNNFEYVGGNFAYEARSIHYNNKKKKKGIYGTASKEEIKELKDEGIETDIIPWIENQNN